MRTLVTARIRRLLFRLAIWELVILMSIVVKLLLAGSRMGDIVWADAVRFFGPALLFGIILVPFCSALASRVDGLASVAVGFVVSGVGFALGGLLWAVASSGFEYPAVFFWIYLLLSIPSAIGGGIVGLLCARHRAGGVPGPAGGARPL